MIRGALELLINPNVLLLIAVAGFSGLKLFVTL
jgi:hypothetical protein